MIKYAVTVGDSVTEFLQVEEAEAFALEHDVDVETIESIEEQDPTPDTGLDAPAGE